MSLFARLIREPLLHFVLIGSAIFGLHSLTGGEEPAQRDRIVVTEGRVQQLAQVFAGTWQRPPTPQELRGLIDAYVKEEVYYREAIKLGLDRDDTLVRRRMQQKMEFLSEPADDLLAPTDAELEAFLETNQADFRVEPRVAFQQVFIKSDVTAAVDADGLLDALRSARADADVSAFGEPTLLPLDNPLSSLSRVVGTYGEAFAESLAELPRNGWAGPIRSPYGLHLVRVTERRDGYQPSLAEAREAVERQWRAQKRDELQRAAYERLREEYEVVLPPVDLAATEAGDGSR